MRVAALTQGLNIPSARFRVRQLIDGFAAAQVYLTELASAPSAYPPPGASRRPIWFGATLLDALRRSLASRQYDMAIVQRELVSTLPTFERWVGRPMIADIDDAIWMYRDGSASRNLARFASHLVVGNEYLAEHYRFSGRPVSVIPTGVDTERFVIRQRPVARDYGVIGWCGTSGGYVYFQEIQATIGDLLRRRQDWKIRFVSDRAPALPLLPKRQVEFVPWTAETEAALIADFDIGLMPLDSSSWSLGKCSYKMLLYMACGVPVVAAGVGMNRDLLAMSDVGLGAKSNADWADAIDALIQDCAMLRAFGANGRQLVEQHFSLDIVIAKWLDVLSAFRP